MKTFIIFISLISLGVNAGLADKFNQQQKLESAKAKVNPEADAMYDLLSNKRKLIIETFNAPEYTFVLNRQSPEKVKGGTFITDKYIIEFDYIDDYGPPSGEMRGKSHRFAGKYFSCRHNDNFDKSLPVVIGKKEGGVYVNVPNFDYGHTSFEIDLTKPNHCYKADSKGKVEKCLAFSKYIPLQPPYESSELYQQAIKKSLIKMYFNRDVRDCKEKYSESRFDKLKFPEVGLSIRLIP